jgi:CzcA family heavy metal efflux pump
MWNYLSKRAGLVLVVFLILVLGGLNALRRLSVDIFPNLDYPLINVITHYAAGSPRDIETLITRPIETQMSSIPGVRRLSSISRQELSQVSVEFDWGVDVKDARQMVAQALSLASSELPAHADPVIEDIGSSLQEIMDIGITSSDTSMDPGELKFLIRTRVANQLKAIGGVTRIEVVGGRDEAIIVRPDPLLSARYGITLRGLRNLIASNRVHDVAGYVEEEYQDYAVRELGNAGGIEDLEKIGVGSDPGISPRLGDIAVIERGSLPRRYTVHINGKEGIGLRIFKDPNANTVEVAHGVRRKLSEIAGRLPPGVKISDVYDQSELIGEAADNLKSNIIIGALLVVLLLFLFLGSLRRALLIAFSIPLSAIISFLFFRPGHLSLNMITLGAMAVAVGMVVDDSIIVLENILRHRAMGKSPLQATVDGTKEIRGATFSGTLTTVAAFIPFLFLSGIGGRFAAPFGWVMAIILLVSLVVSLTIVPVWLARGRARGEGMKAPAASGIISRFVAINQRILRAFLRRRRLVLFAVLAIFIISSALLLLSPLSFLPRVDEGSILMEYILPPGTSLRESDRIGGQLGDIIRKDKDVETVYRRTGSKMTSYQVEPVNMGELVIRLRARYERRRDAFQIIQDLKRATDEIPGLITLYHQVTAEKMDESFSGLPTLFGITIFGEDYDRLLEYARRIESLAGKTPGVESVVNNTKYRVPEFRVTPIPGQMARYGLSPREVMEELHIFLGGEIVSHVIRGERQIPIFLKGAGDIQRGEGEIGKVPIRLSDGTIIPLSRLTRVSTDYGPSAITHRNLEREVTLPMEIAASPGKVIQRLRAGIDALHLPEGYFVEFSGQYTLLMDMLKDFAAFALISVLLVYLIMSLQLGNSVHPLAVLVELPLSFIGAFLAIAISRQPLNLSFLIGLITLIGVSVNNGIVLIDYINKRRRLGMEREAAIEEAARIRARPILLTALTSVLALLPISLGLGIGAKIHQPMAICVMGGLIVNTLLTLNVLPVVYCVLEDLLGGGEVDPGHNA